MQKYNDASLIQVDFDSELERVKAQLEEAIFSQTLFSSVKLVILKSWLEHREPKVEVLIKQLWSAAKVGELVVLNWLRGEPDRRLALTKEMYQLGQQGQAELHTFVEPKFSQRRQWIANYLAQQPVAITDEALSCLTEQLADYPLWSVASSCQVLATAVDVEPIDLALVKTYVTPVSQLETFAVTDKALAKQLSMALHELAPLSLARNPNITEAHALFGAVVWLIRTVLQLQLLREAQVPDQQLAKVAQLQPFVVNKIKSQLAGHSVAKMQSLLIRAGELEERVKSGNGDFVWAIEELVFAIAQ